MISYIKYHFRANRAIDLLMSYLINLSNFSLIINLIINYVFI